MADEITISDLPEYGETMAKYRVALADAEASGDETQIKAVRLDWDRDRFKLEQKAMEVQTQRRQVAETRNKLKEQYPNLPEGILELTDDPAKMEAIAKETHERMAAGAPTGAGWGKGPATSPGTTGSAPSAMTAEEYVAQKVAEGKRGMNPEAIREALKVEFANGIGIRFGKFEEEANV